MSNSYFSNYSFEIPSTDAHTNKTKYSFSGPKEYIDALKQKPVEIQSTQNVNGWLITSKGFANGVLSSKAEKMIGTRTIKIESIVSNRLPKFKTIELQSDYSPYDPVGDTNANYVEVADKQDRISPEFSKVDEQAEQPYERKFPKSSILSIGQFLHDEQFNKMLKSVKLEDEQDV